MKSAIGFSRSESFEASAILAIVTSIPRWEFAQSFVKKVDEAGEARGISRAIGKFHQLSRAIVRGEDVVAEHFTRRAPNSDTFRTKVWAGLARAAVYLPLLNMGPFSSISTHFFQLLELLWYYAPESTNIREEE